MGANELTLNVQLARAVQDPGKLSGDLKNAVREQCRVNVDQVKYVDAIGEPARVMIDERQWE